jgi:hypothetical protein
MKSTLTSFLSSSSRELAKQFHGVLTTDTQPAKLREGSSGTAERGGSRVANTSSTRASEGAGASRPAAARPGQDRDGVRKAVRLTMLGAAGAGVKWQ